MGFTGFRPEGLDLLIQNRLMNSNDFYEAHKDEIKRLAIEPFRALCERMTPVMQEIDPAFVTVPSRMVSRVRRDTRYSKDKTLYRDNMWLFFRRSKQTYESVPAYYMEVAPDYWGYGCFGGYGPGEMALVRHMIAREDKLFCSAYRAVQSVEGFALTGSLFKRIRCPEAPAAYQPWLNRKEIIVERRESEDFQPLFDGTFVEPMLAAFRQLAPFYHLMQTVHERVRAAGSGAVL